MILVIRGHIRNAFDTFDLLFLINEIYSIVPDLKIYIHTWNKFANNLSWRQINENNTSVTEETIYNYFDNVKHLIQHIIIEDDTQIKLKGKLDGNIRNANMPLRGWKNYWYGKHKIINYICQKNPFSDEMIVNFRFDIMCNSNSFHTKTIIDFIKNNIGKTFTKNKFLFDDEKHCGIDNIYIGNIETMYKLTSRFAFNMDALLAFNRNTPHQEHLVFRLNEIIFS